MEGVEDLNDELEKEREELYAKFVESKKQIKELQQSLADE